MNEELKVFKKVEVAMKKLFLTNLAFCAGCYTVLGKNVFILQD